MIFEMLVFVMAALITWISGVTLTKATDSLDCRYQIGDDFGGLILLGVVGSLPNLAVAISAAFDGHMEVIIGNLLGGIAIQTLVIVILDFATKRKHPISYLAGSIELTYEALFVIVMTGIALIATYVPARYAVLHMNPVSMFLPLVWIVGLYFIHRARQVRRLNMIEDDAHPGRLHCERRGSENSSFFVGKSNAHVWLVFLLTAFVTLVAGILLEKSGTSIAETLGISTGIFAATVVALVTSLPEISTGVEAVLIGDNHLAISDIWGGNIFMLVPFFAFDILVGAPVLSQAQNSDRLFAFLGMTMIAVYAASFLVKLRRRYWRLGADSILELFLYFGSIALLLRL